MDPQKFGDSYDFVKSVPRQSVLPVLLPHREMLPELQYLESNASAGKLTVESRQSVQRPVGGGVTELPQIRSLFVSLFFIPLRVNRLVNAVNGLVG